MKEVVVVAQMESYNVYNQLRIPRGVCHPISTSNSEISPLLLFYLTSFAYGHLITGLGIKRTKVYEGEVTDLGLLSWNLLRKEDPTSVTNLVDQTRMFPLRFKTS